MHAFQVVVAKTRQVIKQDSLWHYILLTIKVKLPQLNA